MALSIIGFLIGSESGIAQTCIASAGAFTGVSSGFTVNFNTCTASNQLTVSFSGSNAIGLGPDAIWSMQIGPGEHSGSIVISTSNPTFDILAGLMSGACFGGAPCPLEADSNGSGGTEILGPIDTLTNGIYYLLVTSFIGSCGTVAIVNPTLPVAIQSFSVV